MSQRRAVGEGEESKAVKGMKREREKECLECHFHGTHSIRSSALYNEKNFGVHSHARVERIEQNDIYSDVKVCMEISVH